MEKLSACIITFNEADRIGACCESLRFCDEILVVDALSGDATPIIAASHGARVVEREWSGYRSQRQFAAQQSSNDWILSIDADERVSAELRAELLALRAGGFNGIVGASVPTLTNYFGKFLRHGNAWPDRHVRLFDRRAAQWGGYEVHEKLQLQGATAVLHGCLEHYSYRSFDEHLNKSNRYAQLMAEQMFASGKRSNIAKLLFNAPWRFFRGMVLKLGVLDGWRGLVFHLVEAGYVRRKYLRLWMLQREAQAKKSPA